MSSSEFPKYYKTLDDIFHLMKEQEKQPQKDPVEITLYHLCLSLSKNPEDKYSEIWMEKIYQDEKTNQKTIWKLRLF